LPTTTTDYRAEPAETGAQQDRSAARPGARDDREQQLEALQRSLQEQRRATTLLNAELQKQIEAREAIEAQIVEANAEIAASWDRRKEMTRVIADRDAKLAESLAQLENLRQELAQREATQEQLDQVTRELAEARAEAKTNRERRKEISRVVANRDAKLAQLKAELHARYEEMAALQPHIARTSLSVRARHLVRPLTRLFR
jgi:chromosome segregation ATPase